MEERDLEKRCAAQEITILQQRVQITKLERDLARKQLYIERLERRIPQKKSAKQKAEQVFSDNSPPSKEGLLNQAMP